MRKAVLISVGILLISLANAQTEKKFEYNLTEFGNYMVTPLFDQTKGEGKRGQADLLDQDYIDGLIHDIIKRCIPENKLRVLHMSSGYVITFNLKGEVLNCWFIINSEEKDIISEEELYNIHLTLKKVKFDTTKIRIISATDPLKECGQDYAIIGGSIIPLEYRTKSLIKH